MPTRVRRFGGAARRRGGALALLTLLLPILVLLAGFAVNFAYMDLIRTETFVAADAATRAGGRTFALTGDLNAAKANAREAPQRNPVAGKALALADADFVLGRSVRGKAHGRYVFTPGGTNPNALQITVRRQKSSANGAVPLVFPNMFGVGDFEFAKSSISTLVDVDIALVVDRSGSMAYAANEKAVYPPVPQSAPSGWFFGDSAPPQSRWLDLVGAADAFVAELQDAAFVAHVALVTYGNTASIDRAMHGDLSRVASGLDVYTQKFNSGNTNIGDGIVKGESALKNGRDFASKVVVVMTDGIRTTGPDPVARAKSLGDKGVIVFTVTFSDEADQTLMKRVAAAGLGQHFHAANAATLNQVFQTIARTIPTVLTD